ncbi:MAG: DUF6570 domain-containing protein, partial [Planctomycetota bacterium]|nr:DUF6570 domain-containing protein [Planctomycetota bacterium]
MAFPQADGGRQVLSLPPRESDLVEFVHIVFAGSDPATLQKARLEELGVPIADFKRAYEYLRDTNEQYAAVRWDDEAAREFADAEGDGSSLLGLPPCLAACVAVGGKGGDARQEGPADAVQPGAGSAPPKRTSAGAASAEADANAAADGGGEAGGEAGASGEDAAGAGGEDSEGDEGEADEGEGGDGVEEGEYCAAVADADIMADLDKQWANVHLSPQKAEEIAREKRKVEALTQQFECMGNFKDRDLDRRLAEAAEEAHRAAKALTNCKKEALTKKLEQTEQKIQATRPPPGVAGKRVAGGGGGTPAGGVDSTGAEGGGKRRAVRVVVPTGTEPVSMFSPGFWSAFDPVAFPYGDGVFGLEREAKLTY